MIYVCSLYMNNVFQHTNHFTDKNLFFQNWCEISIHSLFNSCIIHSWEQKVLKLFEVKLLIFAVIYHRKKSSADIRQSTAIMNVKCMRLSLIINSVERILFLIMLKKIIWKLCLRVYDICATCSAFFLC